MAWDYITQLSTYNTTTTSYPAASIPSNVNFNPAFGNDPTVHTGMNNMYATYTCDWQITPNLRIYWNVKYEDYTHKFTRRIILNGADIVSGAAGSGPGYFNQICFIFIADNTTQRAKILIFQKQNISGTYYTTILNYGSYTDSQQAALYTELKSAQPIVYHWQSVPAIQGKKGLFNFTTINNTALNGGDPVSGSDGAAIHFQNETRVADLAGNVPFNTEIPLIYAGKVKFMTYTVEALQAEGQPILITGYKLKFYTHESATPFYTATLSGGIHAPEFNWIHFIIDETYESARLSLVRRNTSTSPITYTYNNESFTREQEQAMYLWIHSHIAPEDREESTDNITNGDEGGDSWQPWNSVDIPKTPNPTKTALETGFTSMYKVDESILSDLSDFLWSSSFVDNVSKFFSDPREIIIGLMLFPVTPSASENATEMKAGGISTGVSGYKLLDQYITIDMGYIEIHKSTFTFLDYPPNTKAIVYLPYCGEHALDVNEIMDKTLHLEYTFDFLTGAVCANISVDGNYTYSFTGQCGLQIPTSSEDFSRIYSSVLSAGATLGTALATIATGGLTAPLMIGAGANMLSNGMNMTPDIQYSSGGGGAGGFIANQTPFLRLELPVPLMANSDTSSEDFEASKQYSFVGKPTYQSLLLSVCVGFTKCTEAHLKNIPATEQEISLIEQGLKDGVIIQSGNQDPDDTPIVAGNTVITFIKCASERNVIGKTWDANENLALEGKLIFNQSVLKPVFIIKGDMIDFNYCYISLFKRYYYITDIKCLENGMQEVSMSVDYLQSFKASILACYAVVERQRDKGNLYMTDAYMYTKANKQIATVPFMGGDNQYINLSGMQSFERANNSYVLTLAGS